MIADFLPHAAITDRPALCMTAAQRPEFLVAVQHDHSNHAEISL